MTMTLIETVEVGAGGAASIEFTSIPQDGVDLLLVVSARTDRAAVTNTLNALPNGSSLDSTARYLIAADTAPLAGTSTVNFIFTSAANSTANTFGNGQILFSNYTSSANKASFSESVRENNAADNFMGIAASVWASSDPITSIELVTAEGSFNIVAGSTASLYKIS